MSDVMFHFTDKNLWLSAALLLSSATLVLGCSDDDKGCETGILREVSCGPGNAGTQVQACVDQAWYITTLCEDAQGNVISGTDTWTDNYCEAGQTRAAVCGSENQGLKPQVCRQNQWVDSNSCFLGPDGGGFHFPGNDVKPPGGDPKPPNPATCSVLTSEDIEGGKTLPEDTCYKVEDFLQLIDGQLIIKPGVTITFDYNAGLQVLNAGRLVTEGTANKKITLRGKNSEAGYWAGIFIGNTGSGQNTLSHVIIRDSGSSDAAIFVSGDNVRLDVNNAHFENNLHAGLKVNDPNAKVTVASSSFTQNGLPLDIPANLIAKLASDLRFENNEKDHIRTGGHIYESAVWPAFSVPYNIASIISFEDHVKLTLSANSVLLFDSDTGISVKSGILVADGKENDPIVMKASDPSFMSQGFWRGVWFDDSSSAENRLTHVEIYKAGYSQWHGSADGSRGALVISGDSKVQLSNVHIEDSGSEGLRIANYLGKPTVDPCVNITYANNSRDDFVVRGDTDHTCQ